MYASTMLLVDLAGSENSSVSKTNLQTKEASSNNICLSALTRVIMQLRKGEQHISYRDSKLTEVLKTSLGGNSKTAMICTVDPTNAATAASTLQFAGQVRGVRNKPIPNLKCDQVSNQA